LHNSLAHSIPPDVFPPDTDERTGETLARYYASPQAMSTNRDSKKVDNGPVIDISRRLPLSAARCPKVKKKGF